MRSENPPMEHRLAGREKTPGDFRGISTLIGISPRGISYQRSGEAVDFPWNTHPSSKSDTANHQKTKKGNILSISQRLRDIEKWYSIMIFNLKENYGKLWYPRYAIKEPWFMILDPTLSTAIGGESPHFQTYPNSICSSFMFVIYIIA